jgi:hypothetical protein
MKKIILLATIMSCGVLCYAQDFIDNALLFSRVRPGGSARIQAIGGASVSLGGDYSSALSNPAGLGMFNRSEFTITPAITFHNTESTFFGNTTNESKSVFNIPGLSVVLHTPSDEEEGFLGGSFGISLSRINDLNTDYIYSGVNSQNSIIDYFINDAGNTHPDEFLFDGSNFYSLTGLAYNNYLIEDVSNPDGSFSYDSKLLFTTGTQEEVSQRKGAQYQWSIAYGANFSDKFFAGASLGINTLRYKLNQVYKEYDLGYPANTDVALRDLTITEDYDIRGSGVNFSLGGIFRPVEFLQIGASFTTPTYYQITDAYTARVASTWNNYDYYPDNTTDSNLNNVSEEFDQELVSEYNLTTPMKLNTGISFLSKLGFISADVEFVNYARAKYKSDIADDFNFENDGIKSEYTSTMNLRVGGEFRYETYRVRAGFSHLGDPLEDSDGAKGINSFSGGLGYRGKKFYVDLAAIFSATEGNRIPYYANGATPVATQKFRSANYLMTFGFIF